MGGLMAFLTLVLTFLNKLKSPGDFGAVVVVVVLASGTAGTTGTSVTLRVTLAGCLFSIVDVIVRNKLSTAFKLWGEIDFNFP
jgi:hypothetical protein